MIYQLWQKLSARLPASGGNFFLKDRRLSASFKKGGFDALATQARAPSATSRRLASSYWLSRLDDFRTIQWVTLLNNPEELSQQTRHFLEIS